METAIRRLVASKVARCGKAKVEAPCEQLARAWARAFRKTYHAEAKEGHIDGRPSWVVIVEPLQVAAA